MSGGVEWALHCCTLLSRASQPVPAVKLAEYHDVSPSYLAKQLQLMSRAGLVSSTQGSAGGYVLTREAEAITVLDVVEAIDGTLPAFRCTEVRQRGPLATPAEQCTEPCAIAKVMNSADRAWRESLRTVTIADLVADADRQILPGAVERAKAWLES